MYVCMYVYGCVCVYACMYMCVCMHNTYICLGGYVWGKYPIPKTGGELSGGELSGGIVRVELSYAQLAIDYSVRFLLLALVVVCNYPHSY